MQWSAKKRDCANASTRCQAPRCPLTQVTGVRLLLLGVAGSLCLGRSVCERCTTRVEPVNEYRS